MIPLSTPFLDGNEWQYVKDCLDTGWVSSAGQYVNRFERLLSGAVGARGGVAVVNGTSALHLALLAANVQPDDEVLVSDLTFVAPINAIRYTGARPVLIDAEPETMQMNVKLVREYLENNCSFRQGVTRNKQSGRRVTAVVPVHILGHPVDMSSLMDIAEEYGLSVIEDATESLGASYKGTSVGNIGVASCFSFNGNKLLTTGGGGMVVSNNLDIVSLARHLSTQAKSDEVEYEHDMIGYNYRMTNIQAAIGCAQMEKLSEFVAKKRDIAAVYNRELADIPGVQIMMEAPDVTSAYWLYTIRVDDRIFGMNSRELMQWLADQGIQSRPLWKPMHELAINGSFTYVGGGCSSVLQRDALSIPCSVHLSNVQQAKVIDVIKMASRR